MDMNEIPVIYAVNNAYAPVVAASLCSLITCVAIDRSYKICIMHLGLADVHKERLQSMEAGNVSVSFFDATELLQEEKWPFIHRFGLEIYLRLYAPLVYPQYSKLLYLDADTIILRDIADLYDTPLDGAALGACWSYATPFMDGYVCQTVGLASEEYFNSGVLLLDTAQFEVQKIRHRCQQILKAQSQLLCFDQDALNLALRGTYKHLPDQWNVQWTNHLHPAQDLSERPSRSQLKRIIEAEMSPYLLHFSSDFKPWDYPEAWNSNLFWEAALDTPYKTEFFALLGCRRETPLAFHPVSPPWRSFRRNFALAGWAYAMKELFSNFLRLDGEVPS